MAEDCCTPTPPAGRLHGPDAEAELATLAHALGHPARVRILRFLAEQDRCLAGSIADELPLAPSTVSAHLKQLREAGLVQGEIDGPRRCYCLSPSGLGRMADLLAALSAPPETP